MKQELNLVIFVVVMLSFGSKQGVDAHRRHRRDPKNVNFDQPPIFCDKWRELTFGPIATFHQLKVGCFMELPETVNGRELTLYAQDRSEALGCGVRIPQGASLKIHHLNYDKSKGQATVYSGSACDHLYATPTAITQPGIYGPFWHSHNILQFIPDTDYDNLIFTLLMPDDFEEQSEDGIRFRDRLLANVDGLKIS
uniref:CUB domain-containing protein n=1 Tax=Panagrellus redivivus TaxID=6233 RepID=A0A7E4UZL5_PANRE